MALSEDRQYPAPDDLAVTLTLVSQKGATKQWQGVVNVGGPSRTLRFAGAYNCEFGCNDYPTPVTGPSVRVVATASPVLTFAQPPTTDLRSKTYTLTGRILSTSKRSYGRRLTVIVARGADCSMDGGGTAVRTTPAGHFWLTFDNKVSTRWGAAVRDQHCVKLLSQAQDIRKLRAFLAYATTAIPWTMTLPVQAPPTVKQGTTAIIGSSAAPLGSGTVIVLERLHGRTAWRPLSYSMVRDSGRVSSYLEGRTLGRHIYRIRSTDDPVVSRPFTTTTVP